MNAVNVDLPPTSFVVWVVGSWVVPPILTSGTGDASSSSEAYQAKADRRDGHVK